MEAFIVFGLFIGLLFSALTKMFTLHDILGFSLLAAIGAFEGKVLSEFFVPYNLEYMQFIQIGLVIWMSMLLIFFKILFSPKDTRQQLHSSP